MRLLRYGALDAAQQFLPDAGEQLIQRAFCPAHLRRELLHRSLRCIGDECDLTTFTREFSNATIQCVQLPVTHGHFLRTFFRQLFHKSLIKHQASTSMTSTCHQDLITCDQARPARKLLRIHKRWKLTPSYDTHLLHHLINLRSLRDAGVHKRPQLLLMTHPQP